MLVITKEQIESYKNYPVYLIDKLTEKYITEALVDIIDFSQLEEEYGFMYDRGEKIYDLLNNVHIDGYETGTQHSPNNIFITINLYLIHSKYNSYEINYYTKPRTFDGYYEEIKDDLEKYLKFFNTEFNKILEELYEQEELEKPNK